jgi:hypothetical protein
MIFKGTCKTQTVDGCFDADLESLPLHRADFISNSRIRERNSLESEGVP